MAALANQPRRIYYAANETCAMGWGNYCLEGSANIIQQGANRTQAGAKRKFLPVRLPDAVLSTAAVACSGPTECTPLDYGAFKLPLVAFSLSGDHSHKNS